MGTSSACPCSKYSSITEETHQIDSSTVVHVLGTIIFSPPESETLQVAWNVVSSEGGHHSQYVDDFRTTMRSSGESPEG